MSHSSASPEHTFKFKEEELSSSENPDNARLSHENLDMQTDNNETASISASTLLNTSFLKDNIPKCLVNEDIDFKFRFYAQEFVECVVNLKFNDLRAAEGGSPEAIPTKSCVSGCFRLGTPPHARP